MLTAYVGFGSPVWFSQTSPHSGMKKKHSQKCEVCRPQTEQADFTWVSPQAVQINSNHMLPLLTADIVDILVGDPCHPLGRDMQRPPDPLPFTMPRLWFRNPGSWSWQFCGGLLLQPQALSFDGWPSGSTSNV